MPPKPPAACAWRPAVQQRFLAVVHGLAVELKTYLVEIGVVYVDDDVEIVGIGVPPGVEALALPILILVFYLRPALVDVQLAAGHVRKGQHIRVGLLEILGSGDHKETRRPRPAAPWCARPESG